MEEANIASISTVDQKKEEHSFKYPSLNGLRAISISIVIIYHHCIFYGVLLFLLNYPLIADGQFGVNVFFIISGFLITSLLLREECKTGTISIKNFYIRRTIRIFPAYYFLLFFYFILTLFHFITIPPMAWLTAITCTKYFNWMLDRYTAHAWSLSIEEHFYLFWPLVFLAGKKIRNIVLGVIILGIPLFRLYIHYIHSVPSWVNELTIFLRLDAIALGCLCAIHQDFLVKKMQRNWKLFFYGAIVLLLIEPSLSNISSFLHLHLGPFLIAFGVEYGTEYGTFANIAIAIILLFSIYGSKGYWFKFLNSKIMNQIGILSYSLYLWQQFFTNRTGYFFNKIPIDLFFILAAAMFSYYVIEKPFLKLKTKFKS